MADKFDIITRNLHEVIGKERIQKIVSERPLKIYWGTAPTGQIHIGYMVPLLKIADFLDAGCEVTILLADLHAFLDAMKSSMQQLESRTRYYELTIKLILTALGVDIKRLRFVKGTEYQLTPEYTMDVYKLNSVLTVRNAKHAGAEVVKQSDNPIMTGLLYPVLQALDEEYLKVDAQFGGVDQRKIFMFANDYLPKIGYRGRIHLMNQLVPGLSTVSLKKDETKEDTEETKTEIETKGETDGTKTKDQDQDQNQDQDQDQNQDQDQDQNNDQSNDQSISNKMSASNEKTKINVLDGTKKIKKVINSAYCLEGDTEDNTLMVLLQKVVFPILDRLGKSFVVQKPEKFGGQRIEYKTYQEVFNAFQDKTLHPADFKLGISTILIDFLAPVRDGFNTPELQRLVRTAYG